MFSVSKLFELNSTFKLNAHYSHNNWLPLDQRLSLENCAFIVYVTSRLLCARAAIRLNKKEQTSQVVFYVWADNSWLDRKEVCDTISWFIWIQFLAQIIENTLNCRLLAFVWPKAKTKGQHNNKEIQEREKKKKALMTWSKNFYLLEVWI